MRTMLDNVRETVALVNSDPEQQLSYLASIGVPLGIDELALELNDVLMVANTLCESGQITDTAVAAISAVDEKFSRMSNDKSLWTASALRESEHWAEVRALAKAALNLLPPAGASL